MLKMSEMKKGWLKKVVIIDADAPLKIKRRLLELGFTSGQGVRLIKKSLLGETLLIEIRAYCISLRRKMAEYIWVE